MVSSLCSLYVLCVLGYFSEFWPGIHLFTTELKQRQGRREQERQTINSFILAKQQLCTYITFFCTFLCRRCTTTRWKCLISLFVEDGSTRQQLSFSFPELWYSPLDFNSKKFANIWRIKRDGISAINKIKQDWNSSFFQPAGGASALQCHICGI